MIGASLKLKLGLALTAIALLASGGCASISKTSPHPKETGSQTLKSPEKGWWHAAYQIAWPENVEPSWYVDAMIAHRVFAPVLQSHKKDIAFWRFHRRAARDQAGHRFSLIFYSTPQTADQIYQEILANPELAAIRSSGIVIQESYDTTERITKPNLEDTTDKSWSPQVQRSWPHFIMGVSEMWLALVIDFSEQELDKAKPTSEARLRDCYIRAYRSVEHCWQQEGGHALLHHLNAIFGYEPLKVNRSQMLRF